MMRKKNQQRVPSRLKLCYTKTFWVFYAVAMDLYSFQEDTGMFTCEGCFIFPNLALEQNIRSRSPVTSLSDAVAIAGMNDTYDLEGAIRLLHASTDLLLQTNDVRALQKIQQWLHTASSASIGADVVEIFGKAIVSTSTAIVDQKVGSGNQWADTSDGLENKFSAAGHKLVRQFLEEKSKRHRALSFLLGLDGSGDHNLKDADKIFAKFLNIKRLLVSSVPLYQRMRCFCKQLFRCWPVRRLSVMGRINIGRLQRAKQ